MTAQRRLQKELGDLKKSDLSFLRNLKLKEDDIHCWTGLLVPESYPYSEAAFRLEMSFPMNYPFRPPKVRFMSGIYHPNVAEDGEVCLPIIGVNWKPTTRMEQVLQSLAALVESPEAHHPLRPELAVEYLKDRNRFNKNALEHAKKFAEERPHS